MQFKANNKKYRSAKILSFHVRFSYTPSRHILKEICKVKLDRSHVSLRNVLECLLQHNTMRQFLTCLSKYGILTSGLPSKLNLKCNWNLFQIQFESIAASLKLKKSRPQNKVNEVLPHSLKFFDMAALVSYFLPIRGIK